jgi:signal transduction histidine kinase
MAAPLRRRLGVMLALRMVLVLAVGAFTSRIYLDSDPGGFGAASGIPERLHGEGHVVVFLVAGLGLSAAYALWLRWGRHLQLLVWAQITFDQLLFSFVVYLTGGPTSGATSLYGLTCLAGAVVLGQRAALVAAGIGLGTYVLVSIGMVQGMLPPPTDHAVALAASTAFYPLLLNIVGVLTVAVLAGYLASRLAQTGGALVRAEERAASAERLALLGRVAAGLAHEIRNPLSSISASIELLRESPDIGADDRTLCEIVEREVVRLNELVGDMMDLARPRPPEPKAENVTQVVKDVVALAGRLGRSGAGDVLVEATGVGGDPVLGMFDGAQLRQVLWNLVKNAVEASGPGAKVQVRLRRAGAAVQVLVQDRGEGMNELEKAQLFDAFFTTRTKGTGLGLAVVRRIVDDHARVGATLEVESEKGQGTEFTLSFPSA